MWPPGSRRCSPNAPSTTRRSTPPAPRIANLAQWRTYLLQRLQRECELTGEAQLAALLEELRSYPVRQPRSGARASSIAHADERVFVPFELETDTGVLSFIGTTTVFGTPVDVTVSEIALECFFPGDAMTAEYLSRLAGQASATLSSPL